MFYLLIVIFLYAVGVFFYQNPTSRNFNIFKFLAFFLFVCIAGLRYNLGVDYFAYANDYDETSTLYELLDNNSFGEMLENDREKGYQLFVIILRSLSDNHQLLFLMSSLLCTILLFKALKYFSNRKYFFFSLLTYFCAIYLLLEMQALRQAMAAGFIYCGLAAITTSLKRAYIWTLCGCFFHNSALIFLLLIPFLSKRISFKIQISTLCCALFVIIFKITWLTSFIGFLGIYIPDLAVVARAMNYLESPNLGIQRGIYITYFLYLAVYLIFVYCYRNKGYYSGSEKLVIGQNLLFLYLIVSCFTWEISFFSVRLGWYFLFGLVVCLPHIISFFVKRSRIFGYTYILLFNLILVRPFVFPTIVQLPFSPYEDYISCEVFGMRSTGKERAERFLSEMGSSANLDIH